MPSVVEWLKWRKGKEMEPELVELLETLEKPEGQRDSWGAHEVNPAGFRKFGGRRQEG